MPDPVQWFANSREALIPTCHWLNCVQVSWICECLPWDKYWLVATDIAPCMWPRQGRNLSFNRSYTKMVTPELHRTNQDRFPICEALPGSWCQVWIPAVCGSVSQGESLKYIKWISSRDILQETPIFHHISWGQCMVSYGFPLKPILTWMTTDHPFLDTLSFRVRFSQLIHFPQQPLKRQSPLGPLTGLNDAKRRRQMSETILGKMAAQKHVDTR
jgi:hypothetical protein